MRARKQGAKKALILAPEKPPDKAALPILKRAFPFRLAATSYTLPAPILPNVRFLGHHLDEVELVLFEDGDESNLPSEFDVLQMARLTAELDVTYNVHLPAEIFLGDPDPSVRKRECATAVRFYRRTVALEPKIYVLHLDRRGIDRKGVRDRASLLRWLRGSLETLVGEGLDLSRLALENLDYPLEWIRPMVEEMGMSFCLDLGHMLLYGFDLKKCLRDFLERTSMIHLHGVINGEDHRGLEGISIEDWEVIESTLHDFNGGVSLEVFTLEDLRSSMERMKGMLG
jgi:sugar phosphate isomerase/epimerase